MVNTCLSAEFCRKVEADGFGVNVEPEDETALADALERLLGDPALCAEMARRGRAVAEAEFDRPVSYRRIIGMADALLGVTREGEPC